MNTIKNFAEGDFIVESKINNLSLFQIDFLFGDKGNPPLLPNGISYRPNRDIYVIQRRINKELIYIGCDKDFVSALSLLTEFCKTNNISP
jgi:hypothetical protein